MKKLYRSERNKKLFGLCGGLAEWLNVDPTLLRLIFIVTIFFSGGTTLLIYLLASFVIPKEPLFFDHPGGPGGVPGWGSGSRYSSHSGDPFSCKKEAPFGGFSREEPQASNLDAMMEDVEKKAMHREIEELRAKISRLEKLYSNENKKGDV